MSDATTLYKLMVLYMLNRIDFTMTYSQLSDFILGKGYTNYFQLQNTLVELQDAQLIHTEKIHSTSYYSITPQGRETLDFFENRLSKAIRDDIEVWLKDNRLRIRDEVSVIADFYPGKKKDFLVNCRALEKDTVLIDLTLNVPDEAQARAICFQWKKKAADVYGYLIGELMRSETSDN
ncbi:MAG: DUF4364 family protein [Lachnospiraceae bacterium]|nr:DUF4364 family protein [Lachnospiraceae bacterium]